MDVPATELAENTSTNTAQATFNDVTQANVDARLEITEEPANISETEEEEEKEETLLAAKA
jgi:hypothetical protein